MAVTRFSRNDNALCGETFRATAVATAEFVDSLKRPTLAGSGPLSLTGIERKRQGSPFFFLYSTANPKDMTVRVSDVHLPHIPRHIHGIPCNFYFLF